jgi:hypothetical protein
MTSRALLSFTGLVLVGALPRPCAPQVERLDSLFPERQGVLEATALLEKTLFRIDVARLHLRLGEETAAGLEARLAREPRSGGLADTVAALAIQTRHATARLLFLRDVGFSRFLDGVRDGVAVARDSGLIDSTFATALFEGFPVWYAPLADRGVREGDAMIYRIRGDTLRTTFLTEGGRVLVDHLDVAPQARLSVMGGFLAPGSDFREPLLEDLLAALRTSSPGSDP